MVKKFRLEELTWEEADAAFESADYIVLPCGATEQHGKHLPLNVDNIRAETLSDELAQKASKHNLDLRVLPTLPFGYSEHHMSFAGTITFTSETYRQVIVEIGSCLAEHGAKRFLLMNAHKGNESTLQLAADKLQRDIGLPTHYVSWGAFAEDLLDEAFDDWGHAGPHETSVIEYYQPDLVREDQKQDPKRKTSAETRGIRYIDEITTEGNLTDPRESDPKIIEGIIEETTDRILETLSNDAALES